MEGHQSAFLIHFFRSLIHTITRQPPWPLARPAEIPRFRDAPAICRLFLAKQLVLPTIAARMRWMYQMELFRSFPRQALTLSFASNIFDILCKNKIKWCTDGWQCPALTVTMPPNMSKYRLPLWSKSHCMCPWWMRRGFL